MSRGWRALSALVWSIVISSCNALFGIEEPHPRLDGAGGEDSGGGGGAQNAAGAFEVTSGAGGGAGMSAAGSSGGDGAAGENAGGSAGELEVPGGAPNASGGGGAGGAEAGGEGTSTGGVAAGTGGTGLSGAAGTGGAAPCSDDETSCQNAQVKRCEAGQWVTDDCEHGCRQGECSECEPNTHTCVGTQSLQRCDETGHYEALESCDDQICTGLGCRDCAPGTARCNADDGDAETCNVAGTWALEDVCTSQVEICEVSANESRCVENTLRDFGPAQAFPLVAVAPDVLRVFPLGELARTSRLVFFALIGSGIANELARLVLYEDDDGKPGALVTATDSVAIDAPGPNTVEPIENDTVLLAGKSYWVGAVIAPTGEPKLGLRTNSSAPPGYEIELAFGSRFPELFPSSAVAISNAEMNLFLQIREQTP